MTDRFPIRTARRKLRRKDRFGRANVCVFCGYGCLESLTTVTRRWLESKEVPAELLDRVFEDHHAHGEAHDPNLIVTLCLNCHREITEGLMREGVSMHPEKDVYKVVASKLRASAVLLESLASSFRASASSLERKEENQ